jgi:hypothetical protein
MTAGQWAQWVLWVPCGIAFLVAATVGVKNFRRLADPMGLAKWDFNQSWASNITIVSGAVSFGILTTVLTDPEMCVLDRRAYTYLALFFPALVTLAPVIFNFTREVKVTNANPTEITIQGRAFTFLFAAALTVWGAAGQVEIQAGLVLSLLRQKKIDFEPMIALQVLFVAVFGALPFYAWLTMNAAVRIQSKIAPRRSFREALNEARDSGWPLL